MILMLMAGPGPAAAPIVETTAPVPVTTVSREALEKLPQSRDLKAVLDYHNRLRAEYGSPPLKWNPRLVAGADASARVLAETGQPQHSSRVGRAAERENISLSPRGTNSPLALVGRWGNERRFFRGGLFPDACTTDWSQCAHFTQMVWSGTTDIGCAFHQGRRNDAMVCWYSPPGNQDGRPVIGVPPTRIAQEPINIDNPPTPPLQQQPPEEGEPQQDGGAQQGGEAGATRERVPQEPPVAPSDEAIGTTIGDCGVGVLAKVFIVTGADNQGRTRLKETHNLAHGFSEVVIPNEFNARGEFKPSTDPTRPYPGTMTASWGIVGAANPYTGTVTGDRAKLAKGKWDDTEGSVTITAGPNRPAVQEHRIDAIWDPRPETNPPQCGTNHVFTVTFAALVPAPDQLNLKTFVDAAKRAGFPGTRPRGRPATGTRSFHEGPPRPYSRDDKVLVPIGTYWDLPEDCCQIRRAEREVIQFARAAIHGPNGRQGKGWGLDILPAEMGDAPNHDPTYTGHPNSDANERPTPNGAGGTRRNGKDLEQWDAPGMPKDLYDRLFAAQGASVYRQQFLSILVCREPGGDVAHHRMPFYLAQGKVCQVAITTVRWDFPGQRGVQPVPARRRGAPPEMPYRQPTITISFDMRDGNCIDLRAFLTANGLLTAFSNPSADARALEILPPGRYQELDNSVTDWETNPFAGVRFP